MSHCKRLSGKNALVTASTAGIGLAIAERLAQEGCNVFICSRRQANVDEALTLLRGKGLPVAGCACHVGNAEHRKALVQKAVQAFGKIDFLISNAAVNPTAAPILETSADAIDRILDINVKSAVLLVAEAAPHMNDGGAVVFVTSITAFNPPFPIGMYAVSKTALLGLTKALAAEMGPRGIRVNGVAPGIVPTKFASSLVGDPVLEQQQVEATLLKRLGRVDDMAACVAFLVSPDASYITGETIVVAGGIQSRL
ncbi:MAG: hypothetical protein WDW36_005861 [Sanguina aurantia]